MIHRLSLTEHRNDWQRAVERAIGHRCEHKVSHFCTEYAPGLGFESVFDVQSASTPGQTYLVQLITEDGETTATCSCPAGNAGRICWHAAAVGLITGHLQQPDPEPDPEPVDAMKKLSAAEFSVTDILTGKYREALVAGTLA